MLFRKKNVIQNKNNKTSSNPKRFESLKKIWQILKGRYIQLILIRKLYLFIRFFTQKIYIKVLLPFFLIVIKRIEQKVMEKVIVLESIIQILDKLISISKKKRNKKKRLYFDYQKITL